MIVFKGNVMASFITFDLPGNKYESDVFCDNNNEFCTIQSTLKQDSGSLGTSGSIFYHYGELYKDGELYIGCGEHAQIYTGLKVKDISHKEIHPGQKVNLKVELEGDQNLLKQIKKQAKFCKFKVSDPFKS